MSAIDILITMASYPIYLKYLDAEMYGLWTIVSVVLTYSQLGQLRIGAALIKYAADNYWKKDFRSITEYTTTAFYILTPISLIFVCVLFFLNGPIAGLLGVKESLRSEGEQLIFYVGIISMLSFYIDILRSTIIGAGRMDISRTVLFFCRFFQIMLAVGLLIWGFGIWSLYLGFLFYQVAAIMSFIIILKYTLKIQIFGLYAYKKQKMKEIFSYSGTLTIASIANVLVVPFNKIILSRYVGLSEVAYYHIAYRLINALRGSIFKGLEAIVPKFSELYSRNMGAVKPLLATHKKAMLFALVATLPLFALIFVFANPILKIWLGKGFHDEITVILQILLIGWFFNIMAIPDAFLFLGIGEVRSNVTATCIKSVTNLGIIFAFIFLKIPFTLEKVVIIDSICLIFPVIYFKYKYFEFRRSKHVKPMVSVAAKNTKNAEPKPIESL